jgi:hypothetical protein
MVRVPLPSNCEAPVIAGLAVIRPEDVCPSAPHCSLATRNFNVNFGPVRFFW